MTGPEQTEREAALAARQSYMAMGPSESEVGRIPVDTLLPLLDAVDKVRMPAAAALDVGWLEFEAAESILSAHPAGGLEPQYSPTTLIARTKDRWERIVADRGNPPLERSRAMCAIGSIGVYLSFGVGTRDRVYTHVHDDYMTPYQVPAAELLLRAFEREKEPEQSQELYIQTLLLLLSRYAKESDYLIGAPAPTRFQEDGNDRGFNAILRVPARDESSHLHCFSLGGNEPTVAGDRSISIPPSMLGNEAFDHSKPHGTLRALLALQKAWSKGKPLPKYGRENLHTHKIVGEITSTVRRLAEKGEEYQSLSVDITESDTALAKARQWYSSLSPLYRPSSVDKGAFETAVNAYEAAMAMDKKLDAREIYTLGSLLMELGGFRDELDCYERAETVFERAALRAEAQKQQDLLTYIRAKIGAANAPVYHAIQTDGNLDDEQFGTYRTRLYDIGMAVWGGIQNEGESMRNAFLPVIRALSSMLLINSAPDGGHLAISPTIRQQTTKGDLPGIDTLVLPLGSNGFRINNAGRLRFGEHVGSKFDSGVITFTPEDLAEENWTDDIEALGAALHEMEGMLEGPDNFTPDDWVAYVRRGLEDATDISRRI